HNAYVACTALAQLYKKSDRNLTTQYKQEARRWIISAQTIDSNWFPPSIYTGCFVATATMGDKNHPDVRILREFRDLKMTRHRLGVWFIDRYYEYGPYPARWIAKSRLLRM